MAGTERLTAEARSEEILRVATEEFAAYGFHGASTTTIAQRLGISQPYIFKLFGTKKQLYLATLERVYDRIARTFKRAAEQPVNNGCGPLDALGQAYIQMLDERADLQLLLQGFAAVEDADVQDFVRERYMWMFHFLREATGASVEETRTFLATGLLLTVISVADLPKEVFYPDYFAEPA